MHRVTSRSALVLILGLLIIVGCSRSPEAKTARHLERGDKFFGRQHYKDATIEHDEGEDRFCSESDHARREAPLQPAAWLARQRQCRQDEAAHRRERRNQRVGRDHAIGMRSDVT